MDKRKRSPEKNDALRDKRRKSRFDDGKNSVETPAAAAKKAAAKISATLPSVNPIVDVQSQLQRAQENARRAEQLKQLVQQQMQNIPGLLNDKSGVIGKRSSFMPAPLLLDEQGRHIDQTGKVIAEKVAPVTTLKANKLAKKPIGNPYLAHKGVDKEDKLNVVDLRLKIKKRENRGAKSFSFVKEGSFIKQGDYMRSREAKKMLSGYASGRNVKSKGVGIAVVDETDEVKEVKTPATTMVDLPDHVELAMMSTDIVPAIEWWDVEYFPKESHVHFDKFGNYTLKAKRLQVSLSYSDMFITNSETWQFIEHPAKVKSIVEAKEQEVPIPLMLTAKERKRIRRQQRSDREKEKQDKIALGIMEAPEPKVKLSNMMRVLQEQAVADPSAIERKVREQVSQRLKNHEMRNLARKLTPEERREKKRKKAIADAAGDIHVAVFRVSDMSDKKIMFKVDVNAQQYHLTGGVLVCKEPNLTLVVVEGGVNAIRRYIKLMTRRIDWSGERSNHDSDDAMDEDDDDDDDNVKEVSKSSQKTCYLVWEGIVGRRAFSSFRFQECRTNSTARKVMETKNVAHYWDMVYNYTIGVET